MGPIAVRRLTHRLRRHVAGALLAVVLAGVVAVHHSDLPIPMPMSGMSGMQHHDADATATMALCVGAFVAFGAAVIAVAPGVLRLGRWRPATPRSGGLDRVQLLRGRARAGPPPQSLSCVWRI